MLLPVEWLCSPSSYNSGDGCDCNCGAPDPDCLANSWQSNTPQGPNGAVISVGSICRLYFEVSHPCHCSFYFLSAAGPPKTSQSVRGCSASQQCSIKGTCVLLPRQLDFSTTTGTPALLYFSQVWCPSSCHSPISFCQAPHSLCTLCFVFLLLYSPA